MTKQTAIAVQNQRKKSAQESCLMSQIAKLKVQLGVEVGAKPNGEAAR